MQATGGATLNGDKDPAAGHPVAGPGGYTRLAVAVLLGTALVAVTIDQVAKHFATELLTPGEPVRLLGGLIYLSLIRNGGAAFSLGSNFTWIFPVISLAVVGWIGWMARRLRSVPWAVSLGLVLGGALGNVGDRLFRTPGPFLGHVVDMISLFAPNGQGFAVFNIADSCLTVGVGLAVLLELTGRQRDGSRITRAAETGPAADTAPAADTTTDAVREKNT